VNFLFIRLNQKPQNAYKLYTMFIYKKHTHNINQQNLKENVKREKREEGNEKGK
jgi:hypothetical protein